MMYSAVYVYSAHIYYTALYLYSAILLYSDIRLLLLDIELAIFVPLYCTLLSQILLCALSIPLTDTRLCYDYSLLYCVISNPLADIVLCNVHSSE